MEKVKRITVFGGSTPQPGEASYQDAYDLGVLIANGGYAVMTGGYSGTMAAVSQGANEAGGHVIGVTCDDLETWRPLPPNQWIHQEMRYQTLRERMYALMDHCDLAMALPGGIGTLAEIAAMWSSMQTGELNHPRLIVIGSAWEKMFEAMRNDLSSYVREPYWNLIEFVPNVQVAFEMANSYLNGE